MVKATPLEVGIAVEILEEVTHWLALQDLAVWKIGQLDGVLNLAAERDELYLVKIAGSIAGTFILQWEDRYFWGETPDDAGYIHKLAVRREYSGKKVGRYILNWAENRIVAEGRTFLRLDCQAKNLEINRYYVEAGFTYRGTTGDEVYNLYEKQLKVLVGS